MKTNRSTHKYITNWHNILWMEMQNCNDDKYAEHLDRILPYRLPNWIDTFGKVVQKRPSAVEVEAALYSACEARLEIRRLWKKRLERLENRKRKFKSVPKLINKLEAEHWLERFFARHTILHIGGNTVNALVDLAQRDDENITTLVTWLLKSIEDETTERLEKDKELLYCKYCFRNCEQLVVDAFFSTGVKYYGCSECGQSLEFYRCESGVIAVLDNRLDEKEILCGDELRVNWIEHGRAFDFKRIEILQAENQEVERFVIQVGNDIDEERREAYKDMGCMISSECRLSANTVRILEHMFGGVQISEPRG